MNAFDVLGLKQHEFVVSAFVEYNREMRKQRPAWTSNGKPITVNTGLQFYERWSIFHRVEFGCDGNKVINAHAITDTDVPSNMLLRMTGKRSFDNKVGYQIVTTDFWYNETHERWTNPSSYLTSIDLQRDDLIVKIGGKMAAATNFGGFNIEFSLPKIHDNVALAWDPGDLFQPEPNDKYVWGKTYKLCCIENKPIIEVIREGQNTPSGRFTRGEIFREEIE